MNDYKDPVIEAMKKRLEEIIEMCQKETGFSREKILCDLINAIEWPNEDRDDVVAWARIEPYKGEIDEKD